jgi:hypothetical protein
MPDSPVVEIAPLESVEKCKIKYNELWARSQVEVEIAVGKCWLKLLVIVRLRGEKKVGSLL